MSLTYQQTDEAATTCLFYQGRAWVQEQKRSESFIRTGAWVASIDQVQNATVMREERSLLFKMASDRKHIEEAKMSGNGQGIDRHLLGEFRGVLSINTF